MAYFRGHHDVAKAIMAIAQAQYAPEEPARARYRMQNMNDDDDDEDDEDSDGPNIYEEIVDEQFTIDNIGQVSMQVKSRVKPITMLNWLLLIPSDGGDWQSAESGASNGRFWEYAILWNDRKAFKFYYDLAIQYHAAPTGNGSDDEDDGPEPFSKWAFDLAIRCGRVEMLADMIKWEGAGLPLGQFVKKTGVELQAKPRFYQGLTVYGKKRYFFFWPAVHLFTSKTS